jgi:hypothetical protein
MLALAVLAATRGEAWGGLLRHRARDYGTLGYGPPGLFPGYQGFGLSYHPGYGYGGDARGVGGEGGYPFYGGPGYPHPAPELRRFGRLEPFAYYGGPGHPNPSYPNAFGGVGPLVVAPPVIQVGDLYGPGHSRGFGPYTGKLPYPDTLFAPYSVEDAAPGPSPTPRALVPPGVRLPGGRPRPETPARVGDLGIEGQPFIDPDGARGFKISTVRPGSAAEKASLRVGDVIYSINGYLIADREDLAWVLAQTASGGVLQVYLRSAADGKERTIPVALP